MEGRKRREEPEELSLACIIREENVTGVNLPAFLHLAVR
jgi:hypothetical protein